MNVYEKPLNIVDTGGGSADDMQETNNYEYTIISEYKRIFGRNPTEDEMNEHMQQFRHGELDQSTLRIYLLNLPEYAMNSKTQSNDINGDIEYAYAKEDMMTMIVRMYFGELEKEPPRAVLLPLRDIYSMLGYDKYLFRAMLVHQNFKAFEDDLIKTRGLKKEGLLKVFDKHFSRDELRMKANDIKRYDALTKQQNSQQNVMPMPVNTHFQGTNLQTVENAQEVVNNKLQELQSRYNAGIVEHFDVQPAGLSVSDPGSNMSPADQQLANIQKNFVVVSEEEKLKNAITIADAEVIKKADILKQVDNEMSMLHRDINAATIKLKQQETIYNQLQDKIKILQRSCLSKSTNIVTEVMQFVEQQKTLLASQEKVLKLRDILKNALPQIEKMKKEYDDAVLKLSTMKRQAEEYKKAKEAKELYEMQKQLVNDQLEVQNQLLIKSKILAEQQSQLQAAIGG